jgi:hypothetical protein
MDHDHFKQCPGCRQWLSLRDILTSRELRPLGLVLAESDYDIGLFYFQHEAPQCRSSFVIPADWFESIIDEPIPENVKTGTERCEGRCIRIDDWAACLNDCRHAPYRRLLIRMLKDRKMAITSA